MSYICKCGENLIFKSGYVIASMKVESYECYKCKRIFEKVESYKLKEIKNTNK